MQTSRFSHWSLPRGITGVHVALAIVDLLTIALAVAQVMTP